MREKGLIRAIMTNISKTAGNYAEPSNRGKSVNLFTLARYYIPLMPTPKCRFNFDEYEQSVIKRLEFKQGFVGPVSPEDGEKITNNILRLRELQPNDSPYENIYNSRMYDETMPVKTEDHITQGTWVRALTFSCIMWYIVGTDIAIVVSPIYSMVYTVGKFLWFEKRNEDESEIVYLFRDTENILAGNSKKAKSKQIYDIIHKASPVVKEP